MSRGVVGLCYRVTPIGAKVVGLVSEPTKELSVGERQEPPRLRYGVVLSKLLAALASSSQVLCPRTGTDLGGGVRERGSVVRRAAVEPDAVVTMRQFPHLGDQALCVERCYVQQLAGSCRSRDSSDGARQTDHLGRNLGVAWGTCLCTLAIPRWS